MNKNQYRTLLLISALFAVVAITTLSARAWSQGAQKTSDQDTVKITADLVQLDIVVTDRKGKSVRGLTREDFELYDNNKLQHISHFSLEETRGRQLIGSSDEFASLPKAITAGEVKRVIAFVVDTLHMKPESVYRSQKMLEDFIDTKMAPGDLVLILPTAGGSGLFQQFTSDQRVLRNAAGRLRPFIFSNDTAPHRSLSTGPGAAAGGMGGPRGRMGGFPGQSRGGVFGRPDPLEEADVRNTLSTLNNLIDAMKKLPGRKLGVFVSEGFRLFQTQTTFDLSETIAKATRASVVFYSIDPRGLDSLGLSAADSADDIGDDLGSFLDNRRDDFRESQDSLNTLALDTGGRFYRNSNDVKAGLNNLLEENSSYYLLGFQPEAGKWDGKFHKVKVAVKGRPDLVVSARKGYEARDEKPKGKPISDPKLAEMIEAINSPLVRRDIDLQLTPFYLDTEKREPYMVTLLHIDASRLKFNNQDGRYKDKLEVSGFVIDSRGKAVDTFSNTLDLNLLPKTYEEALTRGLLSTRTLGVRPGIYQLRMFVREESSGRIGTANNLVDIPDMKSDRLSLSSIFTDTRLTDNPEAAGSGGTLSQRRFKRGSQFAYQLAIYNAKAEGADKKTELEIRTRVLRAGKAVYSGQRRPVQILEGSQVPSRILTGGVLQLGAMPPDDYTLEVTVFDRSRKKDSRAVARQEIDFSVE